MAGFSAHGVDRSPPAARCAWCAGTVPIGLAGISGLSAAALALALEDEALPKLTHGVLAAAGLIAFGAFADPEARLGSFSFASLAFGVGLALVLARAARKRARFRLDLAALYAAALAGLSAYAAFLVLVSRDLMIADFMTYRGVSIMVARLVDAGAWPLLFSAPAQSITQDYAWGPALAPGLALALTNRPRAPSTRLQCWRSTPRRRCWRSRSRRATSPAAPACDCPHPNPLP
jgi:hypothetical protein